ncbi:MAG: ABC transporter ATP-binding protein [Chloroflexi bacterium]|nr:ABC transporter ATP-binding protein [Chloroflexota bacterium]
MNAETPAMEVRNLYKQFQIGKRGIFSKEEFVRAVDGVSLSIGHGETLALVGESGCGKSTLALTLMGLEKPTQGSILFEGKDPVTDKEYHFKEWCRNIQMVFQDPYESLNPLMTIGDTVAEPLQVHGLTKNKPERDERVIRALEDAGLKPAVNFLNRLPHELSGGQRQRVVIAGALVLEPRVILADEPVSMLDVSIRAEILNLLKDLSRDKGISILYITHDLGTAAYFADRIAVMYLGRIVELGAMLDVLNNPKHPYTQALLSVVPVPNPRLRRKRIILAGDPPNAIKIPTGCRFHPRCPIAVQRCKEIDPQLVELGGKHEAACLLLN